MRILFFALFISALGTACGRADAPATPLWKAGMAKVKITPARSMWMSGYAARTRPAQGKLDDLWAKALVLEDPTGKRALLVTMDLVGIARDLSRAVCADLQKTYGLTREGILLSVSHTHSGPVVGNNLRTMYTLDAEQQARVDAYATGLHQKLLAVVGKAVKDLAPARIAWGVGRVTFAVNRRNNREADVPRLRERGELKGPVDHEVPVLSVRDQDGKLRAVVFGYACHATVLDGLDWSGDYPGAAQAALEKAHPGAVALFWAGCGGDQNPLPRRRVALVHTYGRLLQEGVDAVLDAPMHPVQGQLRCAYTEIRLPLANLPSREQLARDASSANPAVAARGRMLLEQLAKKGAMVDRYPYPVQVWELGPDLTWIALGGEVVVDYALRLKKELGPGRTWIAGYTNDVMAYIPSARVLKEGGYEGGGAMIYYGLPGIWGPRVEKLIVAAVHEQVHAVRDRTPTPDLTK